MHIPLIQKHKLPSRYILVTTLLRRAKFSSGKKKKKKDLEIIDLALKEKMFREKFFEIIISLPVHAQCEFQVSSNRVDAKSIHYRWS